MNALTPEGFAAFVQRVRPVSLTPPMPEIHPDVAEWLVTGLTPDDLRDVSDAADEIQEMNR